MTKVKFFSEQGSYALETKVNNFIRDKRVINISYSTNTVGYGIDHYCCVLYEIEEKEKNFRRRNTTNVQTI